MLHRFIRRRISECCSFTLPPSPFVFIPISTLKNFVALTCTLVLALATFVPAHAAVPTPFLVADINAVGSSINSTGFINFNDTLYFLVTNNQGISELWKTDGSDAGTVRVKVIQSDNNFLQASSLTVVGDTLYFWVGRTFGNDWEIWKSDGTEAGTVLVKEIFHSTQESPAGPLIAAGDLLYFVAYQGDWNLWKSDGTEAGTTVVASTGFSDFFGFGGDRVAVGSIIYFIVENDSNVRELWETDGTEVGTVPVAGVSGVRSFGVVGDILYFSASTGAETNDIELWKRVDAEAAPVLVKDVLPGNEGSFPTSLAGVGNTLYFIAGDGNFGEELWKSDGTSDGTVLLKAVESPYFLRGMGGNLYFYVQLGCCDQEVWTSDGTVDGTGPFTLSSNLGSIGSFGDALYFQSEDVINGAELWKLENSAESAVLVKDIFPGSKGSFPGGLIVVGDVFYFLANDGTHGTELWKSDGTASGTMLVKDFRPGTESSNPASLTVAGNILYFTAMNALWKSDGTAVGTVQVKAFPFIQLLTAVGDKIFFVTVESTGFEVWVTHLWVSDGTEAGTVIVKDSSPYFFNSPTINPLTAMGNTLYFSALTAASGRELWKSDGTVGGTVLVKDINPDTGSSAPSSPEVLNGILYFTADDGTNGRELWKSDGTEGGTVLVKDIRPGNDFSSHTSLTAVGNILYLVADDGTNGLELWKSDGTAVGTTLVKDIVPGNGNPSINSLTAVGNTLYFIANDGTTGAELWKSDGTADSTVLVKDILTGNTGSSASLLTAVGNTLYFRANDGTNGVELWKSNGTMVSTVLVQNIYPGGDGSLPESLTAVGNALYFVANDNTNGQELWKSDASATEIIDIWPGSNSSLGRNFAVAGNRLYFSASGPQFEGQELWALNAPAAPPAAPVATNDVYITDENTALNVAAPGVLSNDSDINHDVLTSVLVAGPVNGTLTLNSNGSFAYTPATGYHGTDTFTYKANDGAFDSNVATVTITIVQAPPGVDPVAPVTTNDSYATDEGVALTVAAPGILGNDSDADSAVLTAVLVTGSAHGTLTLNPNGSFAYTPAAGFHGADTFTYKANDGGLDSNVATVTITVEQEIPTGTPTPPPPPGVDPVAPVATNNSYATGEGMVLAVAAPGVLGNDSDADSAVLTAVLVTGPAHGTLTLNPNGSFAYTPAAGFHGADTFTYKANDGGLDSNVATVTITVVAAPQEGSTVIVTSPGVTTTHVITNQGIQISVQLPANAYSGTLGPNDLFYLAFTPVLTPTVNPGTVPGNFNFAGMSFVLDGYVNDSMLDNMSFATPILLEIVYPESFLGELDPEDLTLLYWDTASASWKENGIQKVAHDVAQRKITFAISHLTDFGLFSTPSTVRLYMPILSRKEN